MATIELHNYTKLKIPLEIFSWVEIVHDLYMYQ